MSRTYLVECYSPDPTAPADAVVRLTTATRELRDLRVEFLDGMVLPGDDVAFYRFSATDPAAVLEVCVAARVSVSRVSEYVLVAGPVSAPAR
ncbi:hypothetical protein [Microlunatus sp. GCM10028923]|uniref:hypothetical protein n=1 Tax=Microlunatus sp. GCM10028923 TaxID=3273400 RepID=UPI00361B68C6